jgi:hypothetical protein
LVIDVLTQIPAKFRPTEDAARFLKQAEAVTANYGAWLRQASSTSGYADDSALPLVWSASASRAAAVAE